MRLTIKDLYTLSADLHVKCSPWIASYKTIMYDLQTCKSTSVVDTIGVNLWFHATHFREDIAITINFNLKLT